MKDKDQKMIDKLIDDYNKTELEQKELLLKLWKFIYARKNYRAVKFSDQGNWTGCWDTHLQCPVDGKISLITEVIPGQEKPS